MKKIIILCIALLTAITLLAACGEEKKVQSAHYETVLKTLTASVRVNDTESYLMCFTEGAREVYRASGSYDPELAEKLPVRDGDKPLAIVCSVLDHSELDSAALAKLKASYTEEYSKRIEITKAYELKVEFSSGDKSTVKQITVINTGSAWQVIGPVIEKLF